VYQFYINPLNAELNFICYLLALLGPHHFLHISRIRVNERITNICLEPLFKFSQKKTLHSQMSLGDTSATNACLLQKSQIWRQIKFFCHTRTATRTEFVVSTVTWHRKWRTEVTGSWIRIYVGRGRSGTFYLMSHINPLKWFQEKHWIPISYVGVVVTCCHVDGISWLSMRDYQLYSHTRVVSMNTLPFKSYW
jgi:hypothetical protein